MSYALSVPIAPPPSCVDTPPPPPTAPLCRKPPPPLPPVSIPTPPPFCGNRRENPLTAVVFGAAHSVVVGPYPFASYTRSFIFLQNILHLERLSANAARNDTRRIYEKGGSTSLVTECVGHASRCQSA